jgi:hypothetical protein
MVHFGEAWGRFSHLATSLRRFAVDAQLLVSRLVSVSKKYLIYSKSNSSKTIYFQGWLYKQHPPARAQCTSASCSQGTSPETLTHSQRTQQPCWAMSTDTSGRCSQVNSAGRGLACVAPLCHVSITRHIPTLDPTIHKGPKSTEFCEEPCPTRNQQRLRQPKAIGTDADASSHLPCWAA